MTVYNIPVEPSGPLWDSDGIKWIKREGATIWITAGDWFDQRSWGSLLSLGPLTDEIPLKVGDVISKAEEYDNLPNLSVVSVPNSFVVFVKVGKFWMSDQTNWSTEHMTNDQINRTILRIGGE